MYVITKEPEKIQTPPKKRTGNYPKIYAIPCYRLSQVIKNLFMPYVNNKGADQAGHSLIGALLFAAWIV